MGHLIQYVKFLLRLFKNGFGFILSLPGLMTMAIAVAVGVLVYISRSVYSSASLIFRILTSAKQQVEAFKAFLQDTEIFDYLDVFYDLFNLEVFFQCFTSFAALVMGMLVLLAVEALIMGLVSISGFLTWKITAKILKQLSGGKLDVS